MKETFTREEVQKILVSVFLFASANNNQGVGGIEGLSFGEKADTVIEANESIVGTNKSIVSAIQRFKKPHLTSN